MLRILSLLALALPTAAFAQPLLLIGNKGENSLSLVALDTGRELRRLETGPNPHEIALSPDGRLAAVVSYGGAGIDIFDVADPAAAKKRETIDIAPSSKPHGIVWLADGRIVATAEGSDGIVVIAPDRRSVQAIATGQKGSHMVVVSPDARRAYVANVGSGSISQIDLAAGRKIGDTPAGTEPEGIALSPDGARLWVADRKGNQVRVFDTADMRLLATLETGAVPIRVAISPDGATAVTSNFSAGTLSLFDARTLKPLRTVTVSGNPDFQQVTMLFARDGARLYVAETGIDRIAEVDLASGKVLGRLPAGRNGDGLGISEPRD